MVSWGDAVTAWFIGLILMIWYNYAVRMNLIGGKRPVQLQSTPTHALPPPSQQPEIKVFKKVGDQWFEQ